jgi:hypothetical protein
LDPCPSQKRTATGDASPSAGLSASTRRGAEAMAFLGGTRPRVGCSHVTARGWPRGEVADEIQEASCMLFTQQCSSPRPYPLRNVQAPWWRCLR